MYSAECCFMNTGLGAMTLTNIEGPRLQSFQPSGKTLEPLLLLLFNLSNC